jgi:hypothetical protein
MVTVRANLVRNAGAVGVALGVHHGLDVGEVDGLDVVGADLGGAEPLGLRAHVVHEAGAHDALAEAGEVLDLGGVHERATGAPCV